jgi:hypothetical protein
MVLQIEDDYIYPTEQNEVVIFNYQQDESWWTMRG